MQVSQLFQHDRTPTETELTLAFPQWNENIEVEAAFTFFSLHPLFSSKLAWLRTEIVECPCSEDFLIRVSQAARFYIEFISTDAFVLCLWITLERVLQASFVWAIFVIYQLRTHTRVDRSDLLRLLLQCDHLLGRLVEKWKPGLPYYSSWNIIHHRLLCALSQDVL